MAKRMIRGRSASSLFLIELILAIGFFAVASAVCLQLFVRARMVSVQSADLSRATLAAQSAAGGVSRLRRLAGGGLRPGSADRRRRARSPSGTVRTGTPAAGKTPPTA